MMGDVFDTRLMRVLCFVDVELVSQECTLLNGRRTC